MVYMLHINVLHKVTPMIIAGESTFFKWIARILVTLIISMLLSILLNMIVIYPVQKLLKKLPCLYTEG